MSAIENYSGLHSSQTNAIVHYGWCRYRAYEELIVGNIDEALNNFTDDMRKNAQTANSLKPMLDHIKFARMDHYECFKFIGCFVFNGTEDMLSAEEKASLTLLNKEEGVLGEYYFNIMLKDSGNPLEAEKIRHKRAAYFKNLSSKTTAFFRGILK